jgi:hypothetical protein
MLDKKVSHFQTFGMEVLFTANAVKDLREGIDLLVWE